jgi:hypothetical protein
LEAIGQEAYLRFEELLDRRKITVSPDADGQVQDTVQARRLAVAGCPE